jgi:hypothetical protein
MSGKGREPSSEPGMINGAGRSLPSILGLRVCGRLPLHVRNRVGTATGERHNVILPVAWTGTASEPRGRAGMLALKFPRYLTGSVLSRRERACNKRQNDRNNDRR